MSRRKRGGGGRAESDREPVPSGPVPDPPRPHRPLLLLAVVLTVVWIGALVVLAVLA